GDGSAKPLLDVSRQLAVLSFRTPAPGAEEEHQRRLARLLEQERTLSRQLAAAAGRPPAEWVSLDAVRAALPADAVLVELGCFPVYRFGAKSNERLWQPSRYVAWVVPPAGQGQVRVIDLGLARQIN